MSDKVWVVHLDDAAPSSGFEGVCRTLEGAKRLVEERHEARYAEWERVYPTLPPMTRRPLDWGELHTYSWGTYLSVYADGRNWDISEEELRD